MGALARVAALSGVLDPLRRPAVELRLLTRDPLSGLAGGPPVDALLEAALAGAQLEPSTDGMWTRADGPPASGRDPSRPEHTGHTAWRAAGARHAGSSSDPRHGASPRGALSAVRHPAGPIAGMVDRPGRPGGRSPGAADQTWPPRDLTAGGRPAPAGTGPSTGGGVPDVDAGGGPGGPVATAVAPAGGQGTAVAGDGELARLIALTSGATPPRQLADGSGQVEPPEQAGGEERPTRQRRRGRQVGDPPRPGGIKPVHGAGSRNREAQAGGLLQPPEGTRATAAPAPTLAATPAGRWSGGTEPDPLAAEGWPTPDAEPDPPATPVRPLADAQPDPPATPARPPVDAGLAGRWSAPGTPAAGWVVEALEWDLRDEARRYGIVVEDG
jgi:hypothetical protein